MASFDDTATRSGVTAVAQARAHLAEYAEGIGDAETAAGFLSLPVHRELLADA